MNDDSLLQLETIDNNISVLTLNNAKKYNCLSQNFFDEFEYKLEEIKNNKELRVLIIRGSDGVFSSGANLKDISDANYEEAKAMVLRSQEDFRSLFLLDIPVIAVIDGYAIGGGFELALHCDFRFVSSRSRISFPEVKFGFLPASGGISLFSRLCNSADALYYLLTGEEIPLEKLLNFGIIQKVFSEDDIYNESIKIAKVLAERPQESIATIKKNYYRNFFSDINTCLNFDALEFSSLLQKNGKNNIKKFYNSKK